MEASISFTNLDIQQALDSQKSKAAGTVRGTLGGNIKVSGKTGTFDEMKPTLRGNGNLTLTNGKLVGVNVGGQALKKVQNLPAIGNLVPDAVVKNHPELFSNPDTDIQLASLTFVLEGPRITSHDIKVQTRGLQSARRRMVRHGQEYRPRRANRAVAAIQQGADRAEEGSRVHRE